MSCPSNPGSSWSVANYNCKLGRGFWGSGMDKGILLGRTQRVSVRGQLFAEVRITSGRIAVKLENVTTNSRFGYSRTELLNTAQDNLSSFYSCFRH